MTGRVARWSESSWRACIRKRYTDNVLLFTKKWDMQLELGAVTSGNSVAECAASGARLNIEKRAVCDVIIAASRKVSIGPANKLRHADGRALADAGRHAGSGAISASTAAAGAA